LSMEVYAARERQFVIEAARYVRRRVYPANETHDSSDPWIRQGVWMRYAV